MVAIGKTRGTSPRLPDTPGGSVPSIKIFALIGAVLLALDLYFLSMWVLGGTFTSVHSGPDQPPGWMKASLIVGQVVLNTAMVWCFYVFLIRPWKRERRVTIDGILCIVVFTTSFFDMLSVYGQHWFTYNSYLVNFGSVMTEIPGVISRNGAGFGQPFPILFMPALYVAGVVPLAIFGCWVLRKVQGKFPRAGPVRLVAVCVATMVVVDFVAEGLVLIPLGFWSYGGGHLTVFGHHWYQYSFQEGLHAACFFSVVTLFRFFVNDRGQTFAERGVERLHTTEVRLAGLRFLAVLGVIQIGFTLFYHVPQMYWGLNSTEWPRDLQDKSYFTNGICGPLVDRACPGPDVPLPRPGSPYVDYGGGLVVPAH